MHLVGFIIRIYHDARSPERQIRCTVCRELFDESCVARHFECLLQH